VLWQRSRYFLTGNRCYKRAKPDSSIRSASFDEIVVGAYDHIEPFARDGCYSLAIWITLSGLEPRGSGASKDKKPSRLLQEAAALRTSVVCGLYFNRR
jgi:hypothetical protein